MTKVFIQHVMGEKDKGWVVLTKGQDGLSIMGPNSCPHLYYNPSLTYFNGGNNLTNIQQIKEKNIPITEEITVFNKDGVADNIIIRDPGGLGFFVFND